MGSEMCIRDRARVMQQLRAKKYASTFDMLGYTPSEFRAHIEKQFQRGMSWENRSEWHVDHIIPVAKFIADGITDPAKINHLANLRPIWAKENRKKSKKLLSLL